MYAKGRDCKKYSVYIKGWDSMKIIICVSRSKINL